MSRGNQERHCGSVDRSVEGNGAPTVFDDTSRSRVARKQSRMEECNSRIAGRSAMAPSKNFSSTDRLSRNRGDHGTVEFPNSSFRGVDSGRMRYDRTVDRPDRDEDRRRPVDSRGVSKRRGDREGSSNKRPHSHRRRSQSYERHRCDSCRPQRGDSRPPDDPSSGGDSDDSDDDRRRCPRRGRGRGHGRGFFHRAVVVEIIPMMIIRGSRTTVHRVKKMTISGFPECRDHGSNCRSSMEVSLGRAGGHTSKTALRTN